jgi:hypothetical protein
MAETAAHLVDHIIPWVPVWQWVVSFPIPLRRGSAALSAGAARQTSTASRRAVVRNPG